MQTSVLRQQHKRVVLSSTTATSSSRVQRASTYGCLVGLKVGLTVGKSVGATVGSFVVGFPVGIFVGGLVVGTFVGNDVGTFVGCDVGNLVGSDVGNVVGSGVGNLVGSGEGWSVVGVSVITLFPPVGPCGDGEIVDDGGPREFIVVGGEVLVTGKCV